MDHERSVRELHAFAHRGEPDASRLQELAGLPRIEPDTVVPDLDPELWKRVIEVDLSAMSGAVSASVATIVTSMCPPTTRTVHVAPAERTWRRSAGSMRAGA